MGHQRAANHAHHGFRLLRDRTFHVSQTRAALIEPEPKLGGVVEVDETYIGGKAIINRDCSPIAG